jgi:hypothetical protein
MLIIRSFFKFLIIAVILLLTGGNSSAQVEKSVGLLTDMIDTSTAVGKGMWLIYNKFGQVSLSGYIQPQFQFASASGISTYEGGDFVPNSDNRFRLRRGRLRTDYFYFTPDGKPSIYFVFQFDGSERGVNIRDFWGRYYESKWELFHFSMGMMARPFGHELLLSSANRESPERGRMSQILMNTERDLGFMASLNPRKAGSKLKWLAVDVGLYNGQGLTGTAEYDSHKDLIGRISTKPRPVKGLNAFVSGGVSGFAGGLESRSEVIYLPKKVDNLWKMAYDSSLRNKGRIMPRNYAGADLQIVFPHRKGNTELRAEYIRGVQTATAGTSVTPGVYPVNNAGLNLPLYRRNFDGAYFYFLQNIGNRNHQVVAKFDWYDPNKKVKGTDVKASNGYTAADIRYNTFGAGYVYYLNQHLKVTLYYDRVINEKASVAGFERDQSDDVFTCRAQFSF